MFFNINIVHSRFKGYWSHVKVIKAEILSAKNTRTMSMSVSDTGSGKHRLEEC